MTFVQAAWFVAFLCTGGNAIWFVASLAFYAFPERGQPHGDFPGAAVTISIFAIGLGFIGMAITR